MKKIILMMVALLALFVLGGCAASSKLDSDFPEVDVEAGALDQATQGIPDVVQVEVDENVFEIDYQPIPKRHDVTVDVEFTNVKLDDVLLSIVRGTDMNLVYENGASTSDVKDRKISIVYKGQLRGFLKNLSKLTGAFFKFEDNALVVKRQETFRVLMPNYPDWVSELSGGSSSSSSDSDSDSDSDGESSGGGGDSGVSANLAMLGASEVAFDRFTGSLVFKADYESYVKVKQYLKAVKENASLVMMRIVMLTVSSTKENNYGIDWTKIAYGFKHLKGWETGSGEGEAYSADSFVRGFSAAMGDKGAGLVIDSMHFTFSSFFNIIEKFGTFQVSQNVFVQTLSGMPAQMTVKTETPFIKSVGVSSLNGGGDSTQATAETESVESGVELNVLPHYNKALGTLGVDLKVDVSDVQRFVNLSAGNLGTFQQPEKTTKSVETFIRMAPNQVAVIGGLTRERVSDDTIGLPVDSYLTKANTKLKDVEQLVVVVKPIIVEFVPKSGKNAQEVCHNVRRGDTLNRIAESYGVEVEQIVDENGLSNPDVLAVGMPLCFHVPK